MAPDELARHRANLARLERLDQVVGVGTAAMLLGDVLDRFVAGGGSQGFVDMLEDALDVIERS